IDQGGERHRGAGQRRLDVDAIKRVEALLQLGKNLQNQPISIELGEKLSDLALPVGVIEGVVDRLRGDSKPCGLVAIDGDLELRRPRQKIARHVVQLRQGPQLVLELLRPLDKFGDIRILERELERGTGEPSANSDVLRRLEEQVYSRDLCELRPQAIDDPRCVEVTVFARLEHDRKIAGVRSLCTSA